MPRYVIERDIPAVGQLSDVEIRTISKQSVGVVKELGRGLNWLHSYVTGDKMYCVYIAENEAAVFEHAECGGFPAEVVLPVVGIADPVSGE